MLVCVDECKCGLDYNMLYDESVCVRVLMCVLGFSVDVHTIILMCNDECKCVLITHTHSITLRVCVLKIVSVYLCVECL